MTAAFNKKQQHEAGPILEGTFDNFCPASLAYIITCTGSYSLLSEVSYFNANSGKT